ncbi:MAG: redoxin domain-containing protein [Runella sp.]
MKTITALFFAFLMEIYAGADTPKTLEIGAKAPDFKLPATDNKTYTLASFSKAKILVVVFTCNHCPTAQAYEDKLIALARDYKDKGVQVVAISPNDPTAVRLDELGYTDLSDSFEEMKIRAKHKNFNFPYLYDGDTQATSRAYGAVATPHVFVFDQARTLQYVGRFDDTEKPTATPKNRNTIDAIEALLTGKPVAVPQTKCFGCSVKWKDKSDWVERAKAEWAKEEVTLQSLDEAGVRQLLQNDSDKLRVINVWATWCGPCVVEFPEFITMHRMYRNRDFEFVSISTDKPTQRDKALKFLKSKQASNTNYILDGLDIYKFIEILDPKWQGALPYTLIVEPKGKIVYSKQGPIDALELRRKIVEHPTIGRYY